MSSCAHCVKIADLAHKKIANRPHGCAVLCHACYVCRCVCMNVCVHECVHVCVCLCACVYDST